jgi:uncharacterized membrane protein YcgQ (UPF0703/DUF1980 family)
MLVLYVNLRIILFCLEEEKNMELFNEGVFFGILTFAFIGLKINANVKKKKRDKKFVELQGQACSLLLLEYKESDAYELKPLNATNEEWYYVVNTVYNYAPELANPF